MSDALRELARRVRLARHNKQKIREMIDEMPIEGALLAIELWLNEIEHDIRELMDEVEEVRKAYEEVKERWLASRRR